jgi:hypothetical protein
LAGRVLLKITYLRMRWTFGLPVLMFRGDQAKNAELLVAMSWSTVSGSGRSK